MDAVKFIKERDRMFKINREAPSLCYKHELWAEKIVAIVEEWSDAHPRKTRQDLFLEQWPEGEIDRGGVLIVCPKHVSTDCRNRYGNCTNRSCSDCRREFWMQEVE